MKLGNLTFYNVPCRWCHDLQDQHHAGKCLFGYSTYESYGIRALRMALVVVAHYPEEHRPELITFGLASLPGCASPDRMWKLSIISPQYSFPKVFYVSKEIGMWDADEKNRCVSWETEEH